MLAEFARRAVSSSSDIATGDGRATANEARNIRAGSTICIVKGLKIRDDRV
jgi:hypothetical protein